MRRATCATLLALTCSVAACGSSAANGPPAGGGGGGASSGAPTSTASGAALLVTDAQNHGTLTAHVGDVVHVQLGSTYWRFNPLEGSALRVVGGPSFNPDPSCVPGGGCGTITQAYRAAGPGTVRITASRTSCGEALRCAPNQSAYSVTVLVRS